MSKQTLTLVCLEHLGSDHHALSVIPTALVSVSLFEECPLYFKFQSNTLIY